MSLMQAEVADTETVHLLEKRKKVVGNLTNEEQEILEKAQSQLSTYDEKWWSNTRDFYQHSFHRPKGCYIRQLDLFRNKNLSCPEEKTQRACKYWVAAAHTILDVVIRTDALPEDLVY